MRSEAPKDSSLAKEGRINKFATERNPYTFLNVRRKKGKLIHGNTTEIRLNEGHFIHRMPKILLITESSKKQKIL